MPKQGHKSPDLMFIAVLSLYSKLLVASLTRTNIFHLTLCAAVGLKRI